MQEQQRVFDVDPTKLLMIPHNILVEFHFQDKRANIVLGVFRFAFFALIGFAALIKIFVVEPIEMFS